MEEIAQNANCSTANQIEQMDREATQFFERTVTPDMARQAAVNFIDAHFRNPKGRGVKTSVPAQEDDDDIVLTDYIRTTQSQAARIAELEEENERLERQIVSLIGQALKKAPDHD